MVTGISCCHGRGWGERFNSLSVFHFFPMNWLPLRRRSVVNQYDTDLKTFTIFSEKVRSVIICEFKSSMKCDVTSVLFYLKKSITKLNPEIELGRGEI